MGDTSSYPKLGGPESGYLYEFKDDGVYLTIYPNTADSLLFELSDMRQILRELGILNYDVAMLARTFREASGRAQKIADPVKIDAEKLSEAIYPVGFYKNKAQQIIELSRLFDSQMSQISLSLSIVLKQIAHALVFSFIFRIASARCLTSLSFMFTM